MFVISNFLSALAALVEFVLTAYMWVIIGRAIISWVNPDPYNPIVRFLRDVTDPVLLRVRRLLPLHAGGIDFTPMIVIMGLIFLRSFLVPTLQRLAVMLG